MRERTEEEPKKKIISLRCFDFSFFTLPLRPLKDKNALNLIIDIGNTAAKVALFDGGEMVEVLTESNQSLDCLEALCAKYPVEQGIVATVIDLSERVLAALVALPFPLLWLDSKTPLPVTNLYETPETQYRRDERIIRFLTFKQDKFAVEYSEKRRAKLSNKQEE